MKINIRLHVMLVSASPKLCRKDLQQQKEEEPQLPRVDGGSKHLQIFRDRKFELKNRKVSDLTDFIQTEHQT